MQKNHFLDKFAGNEEIALAASLSFINSFPQLKEIALSQLESKNTLNAKKAVHALKGALSIFCEEQLSQKIKTIEVLLLENKGEEALHLFKKELSQMDQTYLDILAFIKSSGMTND